MEQLIFALNSPENQSAPARVQEIQQQIQRLQREKTAWQLGLDFLNHQDATLRFYGALTLTVKINADWENDNMGENDGMKEYLLEALIQSYVRLTLLEDANFVLQKLCSTMAALFQRRDSGWISPLRHLLACLLHERYVQQDDLPPMADLLLALATSSARYIAGIIRFSLILTEDTRPWVANASDGEFLTRMMTDICDDAFQLYHSCLSNFCHQMIGYDSAKQSDHRYINGTEGHLKDSANWAIQAIPNWTHYLKSKATQASKEEYLLTRQHALEVIKTIFTCSQDYDLAGAALQALTSIQHASPTLITKADPQFPQSFVTSAPAQRWLAELVSGDFNTDAVLYTDFLDAIMIQTDVTSPEYVMSGRYTHVLDTIKTLLTCDGIAMIEDTVCQTAIGIINQMLEGFTDWDGGSNAIVFLETFARDACSAGLNKMRLPLEEMSTETQSWDTDDRAQFQDFRYDVLSLFEYAFALLGRTLVEATANIVILSAPPVDWTTFEAAVYCLLSFKDNLSSEPETYDPVVAAVFSSRSWQEVVNPTSTVPDRARQTSIKFVSETTGILQRHPENLVPTLTFLFSSLHLPACAASASKAILTLCDAQRSILGGALNHFLDALDNISELAETERCRIYCGVSSIIQALPDEKSKTDPLMRILNNINGMTSRLDQKASTEEPQDDLFTEILHLLAAVGKGLRAPEDSPIDLEASNKADNTFWTSGPGSDVQNEALDIYSTALHMSQQRTENNSELIEAACDFFKSGFTEEHPSPFKFRSDIVVELIASQISLSSPNIDAVMSCASSLLSSLDESEISHVLSQLLPPVVQSLQSITVTFQQSHGELIGGSFSSASLDLMGRLLLRWGEKLFTSPASQQILGIVIEMALILMADPDVLPRRAACSFVTALAALSKPGKLTDESALQNLNATVRSYGPNVIALLLRLVAGECARSELETINEPLSRFVQCQPMLTKNVSKEATKPESGILTEKAYAATTVNQRNRFFAQIETLRGGRKTIDVVKEFWITCRGSGFGYVV